MEPYSREWHEANIDRLVIDLAEQMSEWLGRDREAASSYALANRLTNTARALSAETQALAAFTETHDRPR